MILEDKITTNKVQFLAKVKQISETLGFDADWLMLVMYHESAQTFSPSIVNPYSGAVGLIQFMPKVATNLGTSIAALKLMTNVEQLEYVYKYYAFWQKAGATFTEPFHLFLTTFYPRALIKGWHLQPTYIFGSEDGTAKVAKIASQNKGFDLNEDGKITMQEYKDYHTLLFAKYGIEVVVEEGAKIYLKLVITSVLVGSSIVGLYFLNENFKIINFDKDMKKLPKNMGEVEEIPQEKGVKPTTLLFGFLGFVAVVGAGYGVYKYKQNHPKGSKDDKTPKGFPPVVNIPDIIIPYENATSKEDIKKLQTFLNNELGSGYVSLVVDGIRGQKTEQAIADLKKLDKERRGIN